MCCGLEWRARGGCFIACAHRSVADRAMEARWRAAASVLAGQQTALLIGKVNTPKRCPSFTRSECWCAVTLVTFG